MDVGEKCVVEVGGGAECGVLAAYAILLSLFPPVVAGRLRVWTVSEAAHMGVIH